MCKKHLKEEILSQLIWPLIYYIWSNIDYSMASQRCKVPIPTVAVNSIEVIDHTDWLHNELNIYGGGFESLISLCANFSWVIRFFHSLI